MAKIKKTKESEPVNAVEDTKVKKVKKVGAFKLEVELGGETFKADNDDLIVAFNSLKPLPPIQNSVLVRVEYNGEKHEETLNVARARRALGDNDMSVLFFFNNMKLMVGAKK